MFESYFEFVYFVIITITTVGYGDFSATTVVGRILICIIALWGAVLISLVILVVSNVL